MAYRNADPTDEQIAALLAGISPEAWARLWQAADELNEVQGGSSALLRWAGGEQVGTTMVHGVETPVRHMPYAVYSDTVNRLVRRLYELDLVTPFNWPEWDGIDRYRTGRDLAGAPVADAVRLITAVVRSDRFCDGAIAASIEDGTLPAALRRLRDWHGRQGGD